MRRGSFVSSLASAVATLHGGELKLGLNLGYWGIGPAGEEAAAIVRAAEGAGFESVWAAESYGSDVQRYYFTTYNKGAAALWAARDAAGAAKWDAALRCYVARNAWRIVSPPDLRAALATLPAAVKVLEQAGALR